MLIFIVFLTTLSRTRSYTWPKLLAFHISYSNSPLQQSDDDSVMVISQVFLNCSFQHNGVKESQWFCSLSAHICLFSDFFHSLDIRVHPDS
ncbi:hypothetical protein B0H34DRAFT_175709 [Crassisporium funariophilum]|nr:hypothetical protein B0H34DRAFT_175709 [Crassisporium funariophilum]